MVLKFTRTITRISSRGKRTDSQEFRLQSETLPMDRALGVVEDKKEQNNRKGVLSSIATVYESLGFASPLMLPAREINQELCRLKVDWNSELPCELCSCVNLRSTLIRNAQMF